MKRKVVQKLIASLFIAILTVMQVAENGILTHASATEENVKACFYILAEGEERPASLSEIEGKQYMYANFGTITKAENVVNDADKISEKLVEVPGNASKYVTEGKKIEWYGMKTSGRGWYVYGEIVDDTMVIPEPTEIPVKACFYILNKGQERPTSIEEYSEKTYLYANFGTVANPENIVDDKEVIEEKLVEVPGNASKYVEEGEEIEWYGMKTSGRGWYVYGEVVSDEEINKSIEEKNNAIVMGNTTSVNTVAQTAVPMVKSTVEPTIKPTVVPKMEPVITPARACFYLLEVGQERPTCEEEYAEKKYIYANYGYITEEKTVINDVEKVESMLVDIPNAVNNYVYEDEEVLWYGIKKMGYGWYVFGEIQNTNVANCKTALNEVKYVEFDTVADMKAYDKLLNNGTVVKTLGYYEKGDGGAAKYVVDYRGNGTKYFTHTLGTGQHVNYVMEDNTINLLQTGAGKCREIKYNKSIDNNDDAERLNEAIELIKENGGNTIYLPKGEYRFASKVNISGNGYTIKGDGNTTVIYTDNGYTSSDENFITICNAADISVTDLRVEARETWNVGYYRQCTIMYSSNIDIKGCEFSVKENVIEYSGNADKQYTNITLYTGWKNILIKDCFMEQMGCVERGACLGIIDMWSEGCSDATITGCTMRQNAHDEMIGIFTKTNSGAGISNVYITNNVMYTESAPNVSNKTMAITVGYDDSKSIDNIVFSGNKVTANIPSNFMTFGNVTNCVIKDNEFSLNHTGNGRGGVMFDTREGVLIENNSIEVMASDDGGINQVFKRYGTFKNNQVNCQCYVYSFMYLGGNAIHNDVTIQSGCHAVALSPKEMYNNNFDIYGYVNNFIHYESIDWNSTIEKNTFNYLYDDTKDIESVNVAFGGYALYVAFHATLNNNKIAFHNNTFHTPFVKNGNRGLICYGVGDSNAQNIEIVDNNVGAFRWIRNLYGQSMEGVIVENNIDENGEDVNTTDYMTMFMRGIL